MIPDSIYYRPLIVPEIKSGKKSVNTSVVVGIDPTDEPITSRLPWTTAIHR